MIRLYSEYDSILRNGATAKKYRIEIHDESFSGTSEEIKCTVTGIKFNRESNEKAFPYFIMPTHVQVSYVIQTQAQFDFFDGFGTISESGLHIKITDRDTDAIEYIGKIIPDLITLDDVDIAVGIPVSIKAVDGLSQLRDIPYIDTQASNYFSQINDHKMRAELATDREYVAGDGSSETLFDLEVEDFGDRYDPVTGIYTSGGITGNWYISMIVVAKPSTSFEDVTAKIIRIDTDNIEHIEKEERITFIADGVTVRKALNLSLSDLDLEEGEKLKARIEWQDDWHFLRFEKGGSFFNEIRSSKFNLKNVYALAIDHVKNLLQATDTHNYYGSSTYFSSATKWYESTKSASDSILEHIGIPYNAFISDYSTFPVGTLSSFDCLEAICRGFCSVLTYHQGRYLFVQYDAFVGNSGLLIDYDSDFVQETTGAFSVSSIEQKRRSGGTFTYIPSVREMSLTFSRWNTPNFLWQAWAILPNDNDVFYTNNYIKSGETVNWVVKLRFNNNPLPFVGYEGPIWHVFSVRLKVNDRHIRFLMYDLWILFGILLPPGFESPGISVLVEWNEQVEINFLIFEAHVSTDIAPIDRELIAEFTAPPSSGPLEFDIQYLKSHYRDNGTRFNEVVLDLNYEITDLQLLNSDTADNIITEKVTTKYTTGNSTKKLNIPILFSDRYELDQDPGKIQVDNNGEWEDVDNINNGTDQLPYQQFVTLSYARLTVNRLRIYQGTITMKDIEIVSVIDSKKFISPKTSYSTVLNEQQGSFLELNSWTVDGEYTEVIGENESTDQNVAGTLPGSTTSNTPGTPINTVPVIYGFSTLDNQNELVPHNYDLKLLDGLTDNEINQIVTLQIAGRDLDYPTHYSLDFAGTDGKWVFDRPIQSFELIRWKIQA